jgi:transcriptional regulator with XRE-family HTH domain
METVEAGGLLRELREGRAWTITELAKRARVSHTTIRNYEHGRERDDGSPFKPNESKVAMVAKAFDQDEPEVLRAFGLEQRALRVEAAASATVPEDSPVVANSGQMLTVVDMLAGTTDTIIVRDEQGRHRLFKEVKLPAAFPVARTDYGPDDAPF